MVRKVIIDTDPGVDDSMAIFLALRSPELDVVGLTTVFGNISVDTATTNALRLLEIAGRRDVPVARGAADPIVGSFREPERYVHGRNGQSDIELAPPTGQPLSVPAAQFIVERVMADPGDVTLIALAPLTNLALALRLEPRIAHAVREVVLMGGNAFSSGNITPAAEANIYHDAAAADLVFAAPWSVTMVGLDVTQQIVMSERHFERFRATNDPLALHLSRIMPYYLSFYRERLGIDGMYVHDPSTIVYLVQPSLFSVARSAVCVDATGGPGHGKTWPGNGRGAELAPWKGRPAVTICTDVRAAEALALVLDRLAPN